VRREPEVRALDDGVDRGDRERRRAHDRRVVAGPAHEPAAAVLERGLDRGDQLELGQRRPA
jgi:hypothetical protein